MQRIIFGTVIYEQAFKFVDEFITCLKQQTISDFDLLIVNDNLDKEALTQLKYKLDAAGFENRFHIIQGISKTGCISDFRIQMLLGAYERNYDLLIIGDIDDLFSTNRVEKIYQSYVSHSQAMFFYNDLVDYKGDVVLKDLPQKISSVKEISQYNFLGMSNTAINLKRLSKEEIESLYQGSCNIFDWYLYSRLLILGGIGVFVDDATTIYRIYDGNIAGIQGDCIEEVEKERNIKISHYQRLERYSEVFTNYRNELLNIDVDETFYNTKYYNKNKQGYWWSNIRLEEKDV